MNRQDIFKYIEKTENSCWNWTRAKDGKGYGVAYVRYRVPAHRLAYELTKGPIPTGLSICHSCDNPSCINPDHLFAGTHRDNMVDKERKKRGNHPSLYGSKNSFSRLTEAQVIALRREYVAGHAKESLCKRYGVTMNSLSDYIGGRSWPHILGKHGCPTLEELKAEGRKRKKHSALITAGQALEIRNRLAAGEMGITLAAEYGVHKATISDIKLRKIWADI